jgi:hypothetical protein
VFTARYALSPYIKQIRFVFKGLNHATNDSFLIHDSLPPNHSALHGLTYEQSCKITTYKTSSDVHMSPCISLSRSLFDASGNLVWFELPLALTLHCYSCSHTVTLRVAWDSYSDYFPIQHSRFGLSTEDAVCFLQDRNEWYVAELLIQTPKLLNMPQCCKGRNALL